MRKYKLRDVAKKLSVGRATVYRLVKRHREKLGDTLETGPDGVQFLTERGVAILSRETGKKTAWETSGTGETGSGTATLLREMLENYKQDLREKDALLKQVIMGQQEERQRTDSIIYTLTNQVREQAVLIEDLRQQKEEAVVSEYETVDAEAVQDCIIEVDAAGEELIQDVTVDVYEDPQAVEPVVESSGLEKPSETAAQQAPAEMKPHPKHDWGLFKKLWIHMFQPELLRET